MRGHTPLPFAARPRAGLTALAVAAALIGATPAMAGQLGVSPKSEQVAFHAADKTLTPKFFTFKLWASTGKKVRWRLKSYPNWLVPARTSGKATTRKKNLRFTINAEKADALGADIYEKVIRFSYGKTDKPKTLRRNVTLIVEGDPDVGHDTFYAKCSGCHDLNVNMSGPRLGNVYGRVAGTVGGFNYSEELRAYGKVWQERNLNDWLTNTQKLVPGANMYFRLKKAEDRMNIIAFLKEVSP